jgi:DNA-binding Xre family transcriptional regulator
MNARGLLVMIDYTPFWETMKKKSISKYQLIYKWDISSYTLLRMKRGETITTATLNKLCLILDVPIEEVIKFVPTPEETSSIQQQREEIKTKSKPYST